jgi:ParB-like chromosome segregation protein Spo0J
VVAFRDDSQQLEVIDGLKRLRAARALGWSELWVTIAEVGSVDAKVWLLELHQCQGLSELGEGWLVRSLHRNDGLSQGAIVQRLGRHKSWVCRRLLLAEGLAPTVQADVRLGLLKPRAAVALGPLPRGNGRQAEAATLVVRRAMTVRQTEQMVAELVQADTAQDWSLRLARWAEGTGASPGAPRARARRTPSEAEALSTDVATLRRVGAAQAVLRLRLRSLGSRLEARLLARPLTALGSGATEVVRHALEQLLPVLDVLSRAVARALAGQVRALGEELG